MIRDKDIVENLYSLKTFDSNINLDTIKSAIQNAAAQYGVPVTFANDQLKVGGLLNSETRPCLIVCHPEHLKDYFKFVISIHQNSGMTFINCSTFGQSKNMNKLVARKQAGAVMKQGIKNALKEGNWSPGLSLTTGALISGAKALQSLGGSKAKKEAEQNYYDAILAIFEQLFA